MRRLCKVTQTEPEGESSQGGFVTRDLCPLSLPQRCWRRALPVSIGCWLQLTAWGVQTPFGISGEGALTHREPSTDTRRHACRRLQQPAGHFAESQVSLSATTASSGRHLIPTPSGSNSSFFSHRHIFHTPLLGFSIPSSCRALSWGSLGLGLPASGEAGSLGRQGRSEPRCNHSFDAFITVHRT